MGEKRRNKGEGWIYVITNPAWPGYCKIGRSLSIPDRLRAFQTASPHRDFELRHSRRFRDVCAAEREIKRLVPGHKAGGEWSHLHYEDAAGLINGI